VIGNHKTGSAVPHRGILSLFLYLGAIDLAPWAALEIMTFWNAVAPTRKCFISVVSTR
jgi:hypothetical protein